MKTILVLLLATCFFQANAQTLIDTMPHLEVGGQSTAASEKGKAPESNTYKTITNGETKLSVALSAEEQIEQQFSQSLANAPFIRDDIKAYIFSLPRTALPKNSYTLIDTSNNSNTSIKVETSPNFDTVDQRRSLAQFAQALSFALYTDTSTTLASQTTLNQVAAAMLCIKAQYKDPALSNQKIMDMENRVINTLERKALYQNFQKNTAQLGFIYPHGSGCRSLI